MVSTRKGIFSLETFMTTGQERITSIAQLTQKQRAQLLRDEHYLDCVLLGMRAEIVSPPEDRGRYRVASVGLDRVVLQGRRQIVLPKEVFDSALAYDEGSDYRIKLL